MNANDQINLMAMDWHQEEYGMPVLWEDTKPNDAVVANISISCVNCQNHFYGYMSGMMNLFNCVVTSCIDCPENRI